MTSTPRHEMRIARVSHRYAKSHNLNSNHHARVWCLCMNDSLYQPQLQYRTNPLHLLTHQPGHFVQWDHLAIIDLRVADEALRVFREHVAAQEMNHAA